MKEWRLIIDGERSGNENMAVDEAMLIGCEHDLSPSTIRFYGWDVPTLSIGCFQKVRDYYDRCLLHGIPVVTRITGGRAVLHDMELTYSVVTNDAALFEKGINGAYRVISGILLAGLKELGFDAYLNSSRLKKNGSENCFDSASGNEIMINNRKVAGSAQKRLKNAFLQHGSILVNGGTSENGPASVSLEELAALMKIPLNPPFSKGEIRNPSLEKREISYHSLLKKIISYPPLEKGGKGGFERLYSNEKTCS